MNKRLFLLLCVLNVATVNLHINTASIGSMLKAEQQQGPIDPSLVGISDEDAKEMAQEQPTSDSQLPANAVSESEDKETGETHQVTTALSLKKNKISQLITPEKLACLKLIASQRLTSRRGHNWSLIPSLTASGRRLQRIYDALVEIPEAKEEYRRSLNGRHELGRQGNNSCKDLAEQSRTNPHLITQENEYLEMINTIAEGCLVFDIPMNPGELREIWATIKKVKDEQIEYIDKSTQHDINEAMQRIVDTLAIRNPFVADLAQSQHRAHALCLGVNNDPENDSDDEDKSWDPKQIYSKLKINKQFTRPIPNSDYEITTLITLRKIDKQIEEQTA